MGGVVAFGGWYVVRVVYGEGGMWVFSALALWACFFFCNRDEVEVMMDIAFRYGHGGRIDVPGDCL